MIPKPLRCPACGTRKVQVRVRDGGWTLINCYNGECDELPELWSKNKKTAFKLWRRMMVRTELYET